MPKKIPDAAVLTQIRNFKLVDMEKLYPEDEETGWVGIAVFDDVRVAMPRTTLIDLIAVLIKKQE